MTGALKIDGVAVAGTGMVRFGSYRDRTVYELARDAGLAALHDAGMTLADVDEAFVGYIQPGPLLGVKAMKELGLTGLPVTHVENASQPSSDHGLNSVPSYGRPSRSFIGQRS